MNFFAYGSLTRAGTLKRVTGGEYASIPAVLDGYERKRVRNQTYPAIRKQPGARVEGLVYFDLPEVAWQRLDRFEAEAYQRRPVSVLTQDGQTLMAEAYVIRDTHADTLSDEDWNLQV